MGGSAGIASGILFILAALALFTSVFVTDIPELVFITLVLFANVLTGFLLIAVYIVQIKETGNTVIAGFVLSMIGLLLDLANFFDPLGSILFVIGLALLAIANLPTGRLPTLAMWSWVVVAVLSLPFVLLGWRLLIGLALILSGVIRIWLGVALRSVVVVGGD
ncbi:MAG: hypothetical protein AMJ88_06910 [Anaerolineae bacterium SM23_ 63]|nr:MAG: hypothetical protein AMJ88_06910 [Anaerolineae bacterium SM23_ 63]HEY46864.1 hypothetical protein [Anaerolineae bacterium]